MGNDQYFQYKDLLEAPVKRAAYSDRTAWLMAEMSRLAYSKFEENGTELETVLSEAGFTLVQLFNKEGTQAFLAKREADKIAVLAFRGTEKEDPRDIIADLYATFYEDVNGVKTHKGFLNAFNAVKEEVASELKNTEEYSLYITGHSLGGALALIATKVFNSDNLAACYTFGSPKVGNEEFDDEIKSPVYRIVHAYDLVPTVPPTYLVDLLFLMPNERLRSLLKKFKGYDHHGDMRYLTPCVDVREAKVVSNYNDILRLISLWINRKESVKHHAIKIYCDKLANWAIKRINGK